MDWIKIKIITNKKELESTSQIFEDAGIYSLEIEDNEEFLEVLEQTKIAWDFIEDSLYEEKSKACSVSGYVAFTAEGKKTLEYIRNKAPADVFISVINEEDWAENWKKYFKPIPVGENILICPVWEEVPHEYMLRTVFKIDPGMCFGTGTHESTRLCIAALEKYIKSGDSVADLGCGSGILSVIAMLLGAKSAIGVDIDENSARIAVENAKKNNVAQKNYKIYTGNLLTDKKLCDKIAGRKYNIVLMNIIPDVIIPLLPFVKNILADNGAALLSGIIGRYLPDIENAAKSCGLNIVEIISENDWQCVIAGN